MDQLKGMLGGGDNESKNESNNPEGSNSGEQKSSGGFLGGIGGKLNNAAGGGAQGEKNEDMLDKGIDMFQEKALGQGKQDNESAVEQAKDEQISDFIRGQYKSNTGKDFPVKDKDTTFG
ncbi:hypothetical protein NA57DRAFT_76191 [Rhizodiscina lignyota]|uniref:DNA damage-responsive protein 48 n=1 Tax=Rhizodiscina lignyota TaxID=1504668 RepID=A0A9P4IIA6_9PEZI|nr:hypothetical protein NA57DRAFT_76191 [Rhizodiscina lignyota]